MSYHENYEEDQPDVSENKRERAQLKFPDELPPEFPAPMGFLRDPETVRLEQELREVKASLEKTDPGSNHTEMMEMLGAIFVQLSRIYDVLITDSPTQAALDNKHSQGELFASPPILKEEAWNVPTEENT